MFLNIFLEKKYTKQPNCLKLQELGTFRNELIYVSKGFESLCGFNRLGKLYKNILTGKTFFFLLVQNYQKLKKILGHLGAFWTNKQIICLSKITCKEVY